jgi:AraC-like DNA-binding protein
MLQPGLIKTSDPVTETAGRPESVRISATALRFFPQLVRSLEGDPQALLRRARIEQALLRKQYSVLEYQSMADLLELAACELHCSDFGLRLAALQARSRVRRARGVRQATTSNHTLRNFVSKPYILSPGARLLPVSDPSQRRVFMQLETASNKSSKDTQIVEYHLLMAHFSALKRTGGALRARRVAFGHRSSAPAGNYRKAFGCEVLWSQPMCGIQFTLHDATTCTGWASKGSQTVSLSPAERADMSAHPLRLRALIFIRRTLGTEYCGAERFATEEGVHLRTLHRRLKTISTTFAELKDQVRQDIAFRYLTLTDVPLMWVCERLGYAELSVLSRSCQRWFSLSPSDLRYRTIREGTFGANLDQVLSPASMDMPLFW